MENKYGMYLSTKSILPLSLDAYLSIRPSPLISLVFLLLLVFFLFMSLGGGKSPPPLTMPLLMCVSYRLSLENGSDNLIVTLCTLSI